MKLPEIEYGGKVPSAVPAMAAEDQARRQSLQVLQQGLQAFGQELIRTQSQEAAAELSAGLAEAEEAIASQPYTSTAAVREALGDGFDALPPHVRRELVDVDPVSGEERDREEIPTWLVAGALYDKRAKDLVQASSQRISGSGWQAEFQAKAQEDIQVRSHRLSMQQLEAMHGDLRARQAITVQDYVRAGNFAEAGRVVAGSKVFTPSEKEKLVGEVEHAQQLQPFEQRLLAGVGSTDDVVEAGKLIGRLESGEGLTRLEDGERIDWKRRLEAEVREFEAHGKEALANRFKEADEAARNALLGAYIQSGGRPLSMKLVPQPGSVSSGTLQWAIQLVEGTRPGAKAKETDLAAYAELTQMATKDPATFKDADLSAYFGRLSVPDAKHFLDLQRTLKAEGPDSPKYTSFVGPQEETNLRLIGHGFHVTGKDAEGDALAVGYVQKEVNRVLWQATQAKARAGKGSELDPDERSALIVPLVDKLVAGKAWKAAAATGGVDPAYAGAVRDSTARRGKGVSAEAQKSTFTEYRAWEGDISTAWTGRAPGRVLTPREALEVFDLIQTKGPAIRAALQAKGKMAGSTEIADMAVRGYLQGAR